MNRPLPRHSRPRPFARRLLFRFIAALLASASLHAAEITSTTGGSSPIDNMQPGLVVRPIFLMTGMYPTAGDGLPGPAPVDGNYLGEIHLFAGNTAFDTSYSPDADGQLKPIAQHAAVYSILYATYGGNGIQEMALPDLRGAVPVHAGEGTGLTPLALAEKRGVEKVSITPANLPAHHHSIRNLRLDPVGAPVVTPCENRQPALGLKYLINATGELRLFAGNFAPAGWAFAEGQLLSIGEHPDLYAAIGTTWGGDDVSTFALPDLRGRLPVGAGSGPGLTPRVLGQTFGNETVTLTVANIPAHTHTYGEVATTSTGSGASFSTVQPSAVIQFGVVVEGLYPGTSGYFDSGIPVLGEIVMYAGTTLPDHVLPADGRLLQIAQETALHNLIGVTYGGNNTTNFALPDLRGRTPLGRGTGTGLTPRTLGEKVGVDTHVLTMAQLPAHEHGVPALTFTNPSFELDTFPVWPGYAYNNGGVITGWSLTNRAGINPAWGPFSNNGAIPDGSQVAFLQSANQEECSITTTVAGLIPGNRYTVSFRANCRNYNGNLPEPAWSVQNFPSGAERPLVPFIASPPVGSSNPYYRISGTFIATSSLADIKLVNRTSADSAVLLDDFKIALDDNSSPWRVLPWNDDASTGVGGSFSFGHAWVYALGNHNVSFGYLNGVPVRGLDASSPSFPDDVEIDGFLDQEGYQLPDVSGSISPAMGSHFFYGATNGTITLQGLQAGEGYRVQLFGVGHTTSAKCLATFTSGNDSIEVDENLFGPARGMRIEYVFTADATTRVIRLQSHDSQNTFRLFSVALQPAPPRLSLEEVDGTSLPVPVSMLPYPTPTPLDFGFVELPHQPVTKHFLLRNGGGEDLHVSNLILINSAAFDFDIEPDEWDIVPVSLAPGECVPFQITYDPFSGGPVQARLRFTTEAPAEMRFPEFTLRADAATSYAIWSGQQFSGEPGNAASTIDADGDGLPNLLEYAFRGNPKAFTPQPLGLPSAPSNGMRRLNIPFHSSATDLTWTLQHSTNLGTWTDIYRYQHATGGSALLSGVTSTVNTSTQTLQVDVPDGPLFQGSGFWRIKAEQ